MISRAEPSGSARSARRGPLPARLPSGTPAQLARRAIRRDRVAHDDGERDQPARPVDETGQELGDARVAGVGHERRRTVSPVARHGARGTGGSSPRRSRRRPPASRRRRDGPSRRSGARPPAVGTGRSCRRTRPPRRLSASPSPAGRPTARSRSARPAGRPRRTPTGRARPGRAGGRASRSWSTCRGSRRPPGGRRRGSRSRRR